MRLKLQKNMFVVFIMLGLLFYSCVDEPFIEPASVPYSSVRVGNFTNLDDFNLSIDGESKGTLAKNTLTGYFDLTSGQRSYLITNAAGDTVYSRAITAISFEEETVLFNGYYDATNNTVNFTSIPEGVVYLDEPSRIDSSRIATVNLLYSLPTDTLDLAVSINYEDVDTVDSLASRGRSVAHLPQGSYSVNSALVANSTSVDSVSATFTTGMWYYVIVSGTPDNLSLIVDERSPLPLRSK